MDAMRHDNGVEHFFCNFVTTAMVGPVTSKITWITFVRGGFYALPGRA